MYATLAKLFVNVYQKTGTPINVLQGFLRVLTVGKVGDFDQAEFPQRDALLATSIKGNEDVSVSVNDSGILIE